MLSRAVSRFAVVSSRRYAAAASAAKASGSEELRFTLASPDQVRITFIIFLCLYIGCI